ncbi:hypothetical protein BUALT_Bualt04G0070200 [Buddleja alternifolia]|uniref:H15 domain-containing protein n=1 Tax=Buddleja alternifolia TaxID=168488 RepID=A0AAV6XXL6_9LAMI|nr:hypothetical protein BUALT_Bualt04G0070200 [Buddleja alternifolia]
MISEAITTMKDRIGSSQPAIAKCIEENYTKLLPQNFKKILSIQLKRFVKSEKLIKVEILNRLVTNKYSGIRTWDILNEGGKVCRLNTPVDSTNLLNVEDHEELQQFNFEDVQAFTLVGKVMSDKTFNSGAVKNTLLRAWNCKSHVHVDEFDDNRMAFVFKEKNDFDKVVNLSPWSFRGQLVVLQQWHPDYTENDIKLDHAQFWIQVSNLPVRLMNTVMAKIGNMLGTSIKTDLVSECQRWKKFLRITVELDITSPLKDMASLKNPAGGEIEAEIRYERLGEFCFICGCNVHKIPSYNKPPPVQGRNENITTFPFGPWLSAESTLSIRPTVAKAPKIPESLNKKPGKLRRKSWIQIHLPGRYKILAEIPPKIPKIPPISPCNEATDTP